MRQIILIFLILCSFVGHSQDLNLKEIQKKMDENKFEESLSILNKLISLDSNNATYLKLRGDCFSNLDNYDAALKDYLKVYEKNQDEKIEIAIGSTYYNLNDFDNAIKYFNFALRQIPHNSLVLYNIGMSFFEKKDFTKSISYFEKVLSQENDYLPAIKGKINCLIELERFEEAMKEIDQFFNQNKFDVDVLKSRAEIFERKELFDLAVRDYYKVIAMNRNKFVSTVYYKIAEILSKTEQYAEEILLRQIIVSEFEDKSRDDDLKSTAYYDLGVAYMHLEENANAKEALNSAIKYLPTYSDFYYKRSIVNAKLKLFEDACKDFKKATQIAPDEATRYIDYISRELNEFANYCNIK